MSTCCGQDPQDYLIKRVIAVEGDIISPGRSEAFTHLLVPEGHVWVEGDNWDNSVCIVSVLRQK